MTSLSGALLLTVSVGGEYPSSTFRVRNPSCNHHATSLAFQTPFLTR